MKARCETPSAAYLVVGTGCSTSMSLATLLVGTVRLGVGCPGVQERLM